jgi:hypothetical protein
VTTQKRINKLSTAWRHQIPNIDNFYVDYFFGSPALQKRLETYVEKNPQQFHAYENAFSAILSLAIA